MTSRISDNRFTMMSRIYEDEQRDLKAEVEVLRQEIETQEQQNQNLELFIQKVRKYSDMTELTPYAAHELIKAIYVGAPDKSSGKRCQSIHICYDLIGFIPLNELMTQEWHDPKIMPFLNTIKLSYAPRPLPRRGFAILTSRRGHSSSR